MSTRQCVLCQEVKPLEVFAVDKRCLMGRRPTCHVCYNHRKKDSKTYKARLMSGYNRSAAYKRRYGVTVEWYEAKLKEQQGCCAICKREGDGTTRMTRLCIDHCHKTGQIRGLLCFPCNRSVGQMQDNPEFLIAAADYLRRSA